MESFSPRAESLDFDDDLAFDRVHLDTNREMALESHSSAPDGPLLLDDPKSKTKSASKRTERQPYVVGPPDDESFICLWHHDQLRCLDVFRSLDALWEHVNNSHIGFSRANTLTLQCYWDKCTVRCLF